jgi:hypothetical protein
LTTAKDIEEVPRHAREDRSLDKGSGYEDALTVIDIEEQCEVTAAKD